MDQKILKKAAKESAIATIIILAVVGLVVLGIGLAIFLFEIGYPLLVVFEMIVAIFILLFAASVADKLFR